MSYTLLPHEASWLACAVDSEGSIVAISCRRRTAQTVVSPRVMVANTSLPYLAFAKEMLNRITGVAVEYKAMAGTNLPVYRVEVSGQAKVAMVLREIEPYLIIKRARALALLEWIEAREEARRHRPRAGGGTPYGPETERLRTKLQEA